MLIGVVAAEAWRNVLTGASRTLTLLAATTVTFLGLAALDMSTVSRLDHDATAFRQGGGATIVLDAPGLVDGAACERLARVAGVVAAGALRQASSPLATLVTPGSTVPLFDATSGLLGLLGASTTGGISVSAPVAHAYGLAPATYVATTQGPVPVAGAFAYPDDGRLPQLQYAALAPTSARGGLFDQCWAEVWPADPAKWSLLQTALSGTAPPGSPVLVSQLNGRFGESLPEQRQFRSRESRWAPLAAALLGASVVLFVIRLRRLELSMARHLGVGRTALSLQLLLETLIWGSCVAAVAGSGIALLVSSRLMNAVTAPFGVAVLTAGLTGCFVGALIGGLTCTQRQLFRHLKDR